MPALFNDEAIKAQAVASRSYAYNDNQIIEITSSINDQVYEPNYVLQEKWQDKYNEYSNKIIYDVNKTKNKVIKREGKVLKTYYFSMSNGNTENSQTVFGTDEFKSVVSYYETKLQNFEVTKTYSIEEITKKLNIENFDVKDIKRNETNHVSSITISEKTFTGIEFRKILNLRSTDFEVCQNNNEVVITTKGYGHGVGLSQYGANEMAKAGKNYIEILNHYYPNTKLENL